MVPPAGRDSWTPPKSSSLRMRGGNRMDPWKIVRMGLRKGGNPLKCSGSEIMRGIFSLGNGRKTGAAGRQRDLSLVLRLLEEFQHLQWGLMDPPLSGQADGCRTKQWLPTFGNSSRKSGNCSINSWSPQQPKLITDSSAV